MGKRQTKNDAIQSFILLNLRANPTDIVRLTAEKFEFSRQTAWKHVTALVNEGRIKTIGDKNKRIYGLIPINEFSKVYPINSELTEDLIWREDVSALFRGLSENVRKICEYGLSEMLNNAIEHSEGSEIFLGITIFPDIVDVLIRDNGVGIFNKIQRECHLEDPIHAILELSKGKLTTDPVHHSGEGIFFTSRMFDSFWILSQNLSYSHDKGKFDFLIEGERKDYSGTNIFMTISTDTHRTLLQIFKEYTTAENHAFERTVVPVFLARYGDENLISRSQARRLLARFEKFKEIVLDFSEIDNIGQAFADEVFRVFKNEHPSIHLSSINTTEEVQFMISRAVNKQIAEQHESDYSA